MHVKDESLVDDDHVEDEGFDAVVHTVVGRRVFDEEHPCPDDLRLAEDEVFAEKGLTEVDALAAAEVFAGGVGLEERDIIDNDTTRNSISGSLNPNS